MKPENLATFLSLIVVLALILTALIPAGVSASADSYIELSVFSGPAGSSITISGYDFSAGYYYYVFFDQTYKSKGAIDDNGAFTKTLIIPSSVEDGMTYEIAVFASETNYTNPSYEDIYDEYATADFQVSVIYIELDTYSGKEGDSIEIYGYGFTANYYYYVFFDKTCESKGTIDENGAFTKTLTIPSSVDGGEIYEIAVFASETSYSNPNYEDDYDQSATTDFEVDTADPALEIDYSSENVGDTFSLSGSDFGSTKTITVYWDETKIGSTFSTSSNGEFSNKEFTIPETPYGNHTIKAASSSGIDYTLDFSVSPKISLSSTSVALGDSITVSGTGFAASSNISFYLDSDPLDASAKTSETGTLSSISINIPSSEVLSGDYVLEAQDEAGNSAGVDISVSIEEPAVTTTQTSISTPVGVSTTPTPTASNPTSNSPAPAQSTSKPANIPVSTQAPSTSSNQAQENQSPQSQPYTPPSPGLSIWTIIIIALVAIFVALIVIAIISRRRKS